MVTMIVACILLVWTLLSIIGMIYGAYKGEDMLSIAGFCGLIWIVLIVTTVIVGMAEQQYHHLC